MAWVVDSCILLDIALDDPKFGRASAGLLERLRIDELIVCPVTMVELAPEFGGEIANLRDFLTLSAVQAHIAWTDADTDAAAQGWVRYVRRKRQGRSGKRPVADILIGGFATRFQGLITRNPKHFKPYYPNLMVQNPESS